MLISERNLLLRVVRLQPLELLLLDMPHDLKHFIGLALPSSPELRLSQLFGCFGRLLLQSRTFLCFIELVKERGSLWHEFELLVLQQHCGLNLLHAKAWRLRLCEHCILSFVCVLCCLKPDVELFI